MSERSERILDRVYERLLILRTQTGDEAAFELLIARYSPRLRRYLRNLLDPDEHAAEDALQDVWFDVFRGIGRLRETETFAGWLFRVAHNRAYRHLRRRGFCAMPIEAFEAGGDAAPAAEAITEEDRRLVRQSLDRLPHEQREVLLLRFLEEMSYEQIAAAVGCGLGTVRSRLHYAKRALRREIERSSDP